MIYVLEASETVYSSESDCEYEISVEIKRTPSTREEFEKNVRVMDYEREPPKIVDGDNFSKETENCDETRIQCPKCKRTFNGRKNLRQHIKIYHVEESGCVDFDLTNCTSFNCPECDRELSNPRNLRKHLKLCHNMIIRFTGVENYGKVEGGVRNRNVDYYDTPKIVQSETSKDFPIIRLRDETTGRAVFRCGICEYGPFFFSRAIKRHQVKEHGRAPLKIDLKDQIFRCKICNKDFWAKDNLQRHMKLHSDVKNYVCNLCGMAFKTSAVLRKHRLAHIHIKCLLCDSQFTLRSDYKSHHKVEHTHETKSFEILDAELDPPAKRMSHIPAKKEKPIKCEKCGRVFAAMCGFKVHKCVETEQESSKKRVFSCEMCEKTFKSQKLRKEHKCEVNYCTEIEIIDEIV